MATDKPVSFTLTLIRHAETAANKANILQGQQDIDLSMEGENQIKLLGAWLTKEAYTHVYTSDLIRCKKTAEAIVQGNAVFRPLVKPDERLRERCFGILEGCPAKQFVQEQSACHLPNKHMYTPINGESLEDMNTRVVAFFRDICAMVSKINTSKQKVLSDRQRHIAEHKHHGSGHLIPSLSMSHRSDDPIHNGSSGMLLPNKLHGQTPDKLKGASSSNLARTKLSTTITVVRSLSPQRTPRASGTEFGTIRPGRTWKSYKDDTIADILVVTHGGVIRVLLNYFVDIIRCAFDDCKQDKVSKITPNTAATRLVVFIYPDRPPNAVCVNLHDIGHLEGPTVPST